MFGRKGQGAMEYLMTYGWAILVVMIVGIVMWQLGIFNMGTGTVTATGWAKIKPQLAGTGLTSGGTLTVVFTNGLGTRVHVMATGASAAYADGFTCDTITPANYDDTNPAGGQNFKMTLGGCQRAGNIASDTYDVKVRIPYTVYIGGVTTSHTESGTLRGPLE